MPYSSSSSNGGFPISYLFDDLDEEDEEMLSYSTENAGEEGKQEGLPVLYTNDPYQLNQWLVEHVPMDPCCIGFDTEVNILKTELFCLLGVKLFAHIF